jgi:hypothetical protein
MLCTAVLGFRVGMWWRAVHRHGRHESIPGRRHSDDAEDHSELAEHDDGDESSWLPMPQAPALEEWLGEPAGGGYSDDHGQWMDTATDSIQLPPLGGKAGRWREDEDTEVLPRVQDIVPPTRPTPIRRPPWVQRKGRHGVPDSLCIDGSDMPRPWGSR